MAERGGGERRRREAAESEGDSERTPARAGWALGYVGCRKGGHWIVLCAGIAAADGNRVGAAAHRVVAEIGSSKLIAGVFTVSANSPRYRGCCGGRARRAAPARAG